MKTRKLAVAMVWLAASGACYGAQEAPVYVDNGNTMNPQVLWQAKKTAKEMSRRIGVSIDWRAGELPRDLPGRHAAIEIQVISDPSEDHLPDALAYVELSRRSPRIFVLANRLKTRIHPGLAPAVLAHVLVHESTHVLQGGGRHSETGVMKARWESVDHAQMAFRPLEFTQLDIDLIHARLAAPATSCGEIQIAEKS
jgi:hypothetical protein